MLLLIETPLGFGLFKVLDESKLAEVGDIYKEFETVEKANKVVQLEDFLKFKDTEDAVNAASCFAENNISKRLKKLLKKVAVTDKNLGVLTPKLGASIKEKVDIKCKTSPAIREMIRCIRQNIDGLLDCQDMMNPSSMSLGMGHSYSRHIIKFSADKIDSMIVHAIGIYQDLDKELNNMVMRCKEFYGWHFPELSRLVPDNLSYVRLVATMGLRTNANAPTMDWSEVNYIEGDVIEQIKSESQTSMGVDITDQCVANITLLALEVISGYEHRAEMAEYISNRMMAIAPNLTALVGEMLGAKLISHAGSLLSLSKQAGSTVQLLGAEKALFRALKTRNSTPKYGLIYHASLVTTSSTKNKGKMARKLSSKIVLATRADAFGDEHTSTQLGEGHKAYLQRQLEMLEGQRVTRISGTARSQKPQKHSFKKGVAEYRSGVDSTLPGTSEATLEPQDTEDSKLTKMVMGLMEKKKKKKKLIEEVEEETEQVAEAEAEAPSKPKKKKRKHSEISEAESAGGVTEEEAVPEEEVPKKKKKKKNRTAEEEEA